MRVTFYAVALTLASPSVAGDQTSASAMRVTDLPGGSAIGRLVFGGRSMCTGALVSDDLVLTAAHCLYDPFNGRKIDTSKMKFQAGMAGGKAKAVRGVVSAKHHPEYKHRKRGKNAQLGYDVALLRLNEAIPSSAAKPVPVGGRPAKGEMLGVVSYALGHKNDPAFAYPCQVLAQQSETLVMSCEVDFGASGAPVLSFGDGQKPALVSVVSAKAAMGGRKVSVGTSLDTKTLNALMTESWASLK
ncbi:trypsin-like serine peptidase [Cognatishimia activa]|uniref:V8-like Glu-specific endopeptidase n=1 Tax=Cognatishimia activa TaxID=1715691 RepID=A0A0P1IQQ7_9RHOB|nr:trypsin-like serine protease [Cognatishimia activa]MEE2945395.1 trypsin-like serine protease [Pseudomonadota bacterium]CUI96437.1 V8-like Glu-specific endopeptidase [Cognatishimia activa]CUK25863.1 V8-like Glu-specific endopeptidase [Cognatishimia activa]